MHILRIKYVPYQIAKKKEYLEEEKIWSANLNLHL